MHILRSRIDEFRAGDEATLSADERARADRFATADLRRRSVAAHAFVRRTLAEHAGVPAAALRFTIGPFGKPALRDFSDLHFNLSHAGDWAICAVSRASPLGIDIEQARPLPEFRDLAARFFSSAEQRTLAALPISKQMRAFFEIWTKKEAYIKATGRGLAQSLQEFSVPLGTDGPVRPDARWLVRALPAPDGYVAALATRY